MNKKNSKSFRNMEVVMLVYNPIRLHTSIDSQAMQGKIRILRPTKG